MKSEESGAGRFTDFVLPPVTFYEYLILIGIESESLITVKKNDTQPDSYDLQWSKIEEINQHFIDYLNYGGYPEAVLSPAIRNDPGRFIRSDIIEKVITRDLPSLYGVYDISELNRLFTSLAYNTGEEVSLEGLSQEAGVAKETIKRYIGYLEAAFLIRILHRVDDSAKQFSRANFFKVYLTNPCMRSALFGPIAADSEHIGSLVETAVVAQWLHSERSMHYARWKNGEVDVVFLDSLMFRPYQAVESKWSDACANNLGTIKSLCKFLRQHPSCSAVVTSRSLSAKRTIEGRTVPFIPSAVYCYFIGKITIADRRDSMLGVSVDNAESST